jgi:ribosomal protein L37AE/L43A
MEPLVTGIYQCPQCKKIMKEEDKTAKIEQQKKIEEGEFQDGEHYHKTVSLNKQYEICEKGITINKTDNRMFAVLICHSPLLKSEQYIRLSWFKKSFYQHAGMIKIYDKEVLKNIIIALENIDNNFDDLWTFHGKFRKTSPKTKERQEKETKLDIIKYRILENRTCPKCQKKMDKMKSHYECQHCGEIVILEGYNQPIFNIAPSDLDLTFQGDFPINYYMPVAGITVKWLMGEWKALVVIYSKDNPNKKWLRFYWWNRDLQNILKYGQREIGEGTQMGWKTQKGVSSPNIYDKKLLKPLIDALKKSAKELTWDFNN